MDLTQGFSKYHNCSALLQPNSAAIALFVWCNSSLQGSLWCQPQEQPKSNPSAPGCHPGTRRDGATAGQRRQWCQCWGRGWGHGHAHCLGTTAADVSRDGETWRGDGVAPSFHGELGTGEIPAPRAGECMVMMVWLQIVGSKGAKDGSEIVQSPSS